MSGPASWEPIVREAYFLDFEDWLDKEIRDDDEAWVTIIPDPLENGQDLSTYWFLQQADNANQRDDKCFEDFWLRKAAQRGNWVAMQALADMRYELGHLAEAMRWNYRLLDALLDSASNLSDLDPEPSAEDWRLDIESAIKNIAYLVGQGIGLGEGMFSNNPKDLGKIRQYRDFTYCLKCGSMKYAFAPIEQCDDSVHASFRGFGG